MSEAYAREEILAGARSTGTGVHTQRSSQANKLVRSAQPVLSVSRCTQWSVLSQGQCTQCTVQWQCSVSVCALSAQCSTRSVHLTSALSAECALCVVWTIEAEKSAAARELGRPA